MFHFIVVCRAAGARVAGWLLLLAVAVGAGGCASLSRKVIQGTGHGAAWAVVPADADYALVTLSTAGGGRLVAQFGQATDATGAVLADYARRPTVIYGYPGGYTLQRSQPEFAAWRRLGVNVIVPEYPGFGMSAGEPGEAGCYAAFDAVYDYVRQRSDLAASPVIAAGWSVGGGAAVDLASRRPVAGLIAIGVSTNIDDVARHLAAQRAPFSWLPGWLVGWLAPGCLLDSMAKLPAVSCPVLLVRGEKDELIPAAMTDRLAAAAKTPVTRYTVAGARHADIFQVGGPALWQAVGDWLAALPGARCTQAPAPHRRISPASGSFSSGVSRQETGKADCRRVQRTAQRRSVSASCRAEPKS